jgi:ribosomal protein S18 acetylase RimI-like enzyme
VRVRVDDSLEGIDWDSVVSDLVHDDFHNGRPALSLRRSFERSQHVAIARDEDDGGRVVGMARLLSDGVCNAYLLDVWTHSAYRQRGVASSMVQALTAQVPGQHVGLQTGEAQSFYAALGFRPQPEFMSKIVGAWLDTGSSRP